METSPPPVSPAAPISSRKNCVWLGCGALALILVTAVIAVAATLWWLKRPIEPVTLDAKEQAVLDEKVRVFEQARENPPATHAPAPGQPNEGGAPAPEPVYLPGSKTLRLTERELNALLNQNTELGDKVRIELARDAVHAYLAVPIPPDFPIGGGTTFRARGRFQIKVVEGEVPTAILEDVTVLGLSLPRAWLADLKGRNFFGEEARKAGKGAFLQGVKSLKVEPGNLVLEVHE
jgi:arginine N-succinyltransferase